MGKKFTYETDILGYSILRNEDLDAIHEATLDLMGDYGLQIHGKRGLGYSGRSRLYHRPKL
jgi:hypothetical protein